jgi:hypothetical protein
MGPPSGQVLDNGIASDLPEMVLFDPKAARARDRPVHTGSMNTAQRTPIDGGGAGEHAAGMSATTPRRVRKRDLPAESIESGVQDGFRLPVIG